MSNYTFASGEMLLLRLQNAIKQGKKIAILAGSGLTLANLEKGELGVSSANEIVEDIRQLFISHNQENLFNSHVTDSLHPPEKYQAAMQTLLSCFGQDELNKVIIRAVLSSMSNKAVINSDQQELNPEAIEKEEKNWFLRSGVDALGELFVDFNEKFSGPILTSNFDPLLEISIRKHGGNPQSIFIVNDGKFLNQKSDNTHSVVHFHGYWYGSDTLHTIDQLKRERPLLKGDLKKLFQNSVLLVIGYGGWNDVFTNTLLDLIKEGNNNFDVLWSFYGHEDDKIKKENSYILKGMSDSLGQRVVLYKDVDVHDLFPKLLEFLNANISTSSELLKPPRLQSPDILEINAEEKRLSEEAFVCDTPPNNLFWAGRKNEVNFLANEDYKTCVISGIGGQGKSGLASHFVRHVVKNSDIELWDWRDCKEEDNKFQTILILQIERLSNGRYRSSKLSAETVLDLIELFFKVLDQRKIVFVYDNIDNYIDLEKFIPIGGIGKLFEEANKRVHHSKFIFTCRPHINSSYSSFTKIVLRELSLEETIELFKEYKPAFSSADLEEIARESHYLSNGHALWLTLIGAQVRRGLQVVKEFLKNYQQNKILQQNNFNTSVERTLDVVWKSLNIKQQTLLRGMGEIVTAFSKNELEDIFKPELSLNQFNKAFNTLNSLNLLVVKSSLGKKDLFELHPLVKEYIIQKYKRNERSKFIVLVVNFYDQIILWIKPKLDADSPLSYFEKYTQKAELHINNNDLKSALLSLHEVSQVIHAAGFSEEYLRVATILFRAIDWLKAVTEEYTYFHDEIYTFIHTLVDKGKFLDVEEYLEKYQLVIPGKSIHYLSYCNSNAYYYWFKDEYETAIDWAERGIQLQKQTGVGIAADLHRNLALSLRDTKEKENLEKAISILLKGESKNEILEQDFSSENFTSEFFGNIGRCLWYKNEVEEASICYFKSFNLLQEEKTSTTVLNLGYASLWIAEISLFLEDKKSALYFLKYCLLNWDKAAPIKALNVRRNYEALLNEQENMQFLVTLTNWDIEKYCLEYVEYHLRKIYEQKGI